jgi:hypothetical protein
MQRISGLGGALVLFLAGQNPAGAQSAAPSELEQLKSLVSAQQKLLERQQAEIDALQKAIAEQKEMLSSALRKDTSGAAAKAAAGGDDKAKQAAGSQAENRPSPSESQHLSPQQMQVEEELQRGPEIAEVTPDTPALKLGPANIRLIGYPALTGIYRSTNSGGNVGTSFANIPYDNTVEGNTSEFRLSAQSTRLGLRADADLGRGQAAGYFEMDFAGSVPGNVAVTSTSYGFRLRQAWLDYAADKWEVTGGQLFTLMTPVRKDILPWPGDVAVTQVIDTNYVAGLVWGRFPQLRVVYHASPAASFGFSIENPEQQVGNGVVFPAALAPTLNEQYNTGDNGLAVPNALPDFVFKASFDGNPGGHAAHLDLGSVFRVFRNYAPASGVSGHNTAEGFGVNANLNFDIVKNVRFVLNGFYGDGAGRYLGGLVPDVIVRADGSIAPITAYSWVSGFEVAPTKATGLYLYYSGVYADRKTAVDLDGSLIGFGYPGASNVADRVIDEATAGFSWVLWKYENLGSLQLGFQYAYVRVRPWSAAGGPDRAQTQMVLSQLRYNLP